MQPSNAHEWCRHTFALATLESLELISHAHMANDLQYVAAQVAPYFVAASDCLRYLGADLADLVMVKIESNDLRENMGLLQDERCKFEECYMGRWGVCRTKCEIWWQGRKC